MKPCRSSISRARFTSVTPRLAKLDSLWTFCKNTHHSSSQCLYFLVIMPDAENFLQSDIV